MNKRTLLIVALVSICFSLLSCKKEDPVKIGLVAGFSGRASQLAVQARNGMSIAIEEINNDGGLLGNPVEFIYVDHQNDRDICVEAVYDLINDEKVDVIIGPMMSGMAAHVIEGASESDKLIIAPTVSTDALTGIDDNFFRVTSPASDQGKALAKLVLQKNLNDMVLVYDEKNKSYADAIIEGFTSVTKGTETALVNISSFYEKEDFTALVNDLLKLSAHGMILVTSGIDAAAIVQLYSRSKDLPPLFTGSWAKVTDIVSYGGRHIEGMLIIDTYVNEKPIARELDFTSDYEKRFSESPNIGAVATYESVKLYAAAVEKAQSKSSQNVKENILNFGEILGVRDTFSIDQFGDGMRELSTFIVKDGAYELVLEGR